MATAIDICDVMTVRESGGETAHDFCVLESAHSVRSWAIDEFGNAVGSAVVTKTDHQYQNGRQRMAINDEVVQLEEVTSILTPADGVTLDQSLADAALLGYQVLDRDDENNRATITWFKRGA